VERRVLVVNADDFGQSAGVNRGIVRAHEEGIVTSASLMVRHPAAAAAATYARGHATLGVGLHIDLGEWMYREGAWAAVYEVVRLEDTPAVAAEVERQLERFLALVGRQPTHLDSHQHVHLKPGVRAAVMPFAERLDVPLRSVTPGVRHAGEFYGQTSQGEHLPGAISVERLLSIVRALPPGITELGCHPGLADELVTMYHAERMEELEVLCDPRVRRAIADLAIDLRSFAAVAPSLRPCVRAAGGLVQDPP
jgi:chitin disaccharide deacetylase